MQSNDFSVMLEDVQFRSVIVDKKKEIRRTLSKSDLRVFAQSLARLLEGGIPILRALEGMKQAVRKARLVKFLEVLILYVGQGMSLKEALEKTKAVPPLFSQIVYAGEISGSTPVVLNHLARYLEQEANLKRKISEAVAYPFFILLMGVITLGILLHVVLPKLAAVYEDYEQDLPLITKLVLGASDLFFPVLIGLSLWTILIVMVLVRKPGLWHLFVHKIPLAGKFLQTCALVRFAQLFGLLLESGVSILNAVETAMRTTPAFMKQDIANLKTGLSEGKKLSACLEPVSWMDHLSKMLISAGEESGRVTESFVQIARDTETRLEAQIQIMMKLLEPCLILVIGIVIGFVVIGTVFPIFNISGLVK